MHALATRIAALLGIVFVAIGGLILVTMEGEPVRQRLMSMEGAIGLVGLALAAAWCVMLPLARRVTRMASDADAMSARLADQNALLAQTARRRRDLLVNVSHDLRTPLASMQGYLELLLLRHGSLEPAEAQNYLQTAARQSERLSRLVSDLFELTRLEGEDMKPQSEPFAIAELAHDVVQRFAADAGHRGVSLGATGGIGSGASTLVLADIALVERVLGNLVENSLRHTSAGGDVVIEIGDGDGVAEVTVRDNGEGIAARDLAGIFERFDDASRTGDSGSSRAGLGLAIARRIAALHGSVLQITSQPGCGTRVAFALPLAPRPARALHADAAAAHRQGNR